MIIFKFRVLRKFSSEDKKLRPSTEFVQRRRIRAPHLNFGNFFRKMIPLKGRVSDKNETGGNIFNHDQSPQLRKTHIRKIFFLTPIAGGAKQQQLQQQQLQQHQQHHLTSSSSAF